MHDEHHTSFYRQTRLSSVRRNFFAVMLFLCLERVLIWNNIGSINSIAEGVMEISMRGWGRNMGTRKIADYNLSAMTVSRDPQKIVYFGQSGLFKSYGEV